jgi:hypothetical protein
VTGAAARARAAWTLVALAAVFVAVAARYRPPAPLPADAGVEQFAAARAARVLERLLGSGQPHPAGSAENAAVRGRLAAELRALGLEPHLGAATVGTRGLVARVHNVAARIEGREPGPAAVLSCHYDSVAAGPGASDDGASVAAVIEAARALLAGGVPRRPVLLAFTDAEEVGLLGARAFAREHAAEEIDGVVNLEARGTTGPSLMFETCGDDRALIAAFATVPRPIGSSVFGTVYRTLPNDTDLSVFRRAGWRGVNFAFVGGASRYHTPLDDLAHVDLGSLQHQGECALALVRALTARDLAPEPAGGTVFTDVLAACVVAWPRAYDQVWVGLVLALSAFTAGLALARGRGRARCVLRGALWPLAALAGGALAGAALFALLRLTGGLENPWPPSLAPMSAAYGCAAAAVVLRLGFALAERADAGSWWLGQVATSAAAAAALGLLAPGASYLLSLPAAFGAAAAGVLALRGASSRAFAAAAILAVAAHAALWFPVCWLMPSALGVRAGPIHGALIAVALAPAAPLLAPALRGRAEVPLALALAACIAAAAARLSREYDAHHRQHVNVEFVEHAEDAVAGIDPGQTALPAPLRGWPGLAPARERLLPWRSEVWTAPVARAGLPPPELTLLHRSDAGDRTILRGLLRSARGAPLLTLHFPPHVHPVSLRLDGVAVALPRVPRVNGWLSAGFLGADSDGVEVEVRFRGQPREMVIGDASPGLPPPAAALAERRDGAGACPAYAGDVTRVVRSVRL